MRHLKIKEIRDQLGLNHRRHMTGERSIHPPRPAFPAVITRPYQVSGSHISKSTEDVGDVVATPITRQMLTELTQVGTKHVGSAEAVKFVPEATRVALVIVTLGRLRESSDVQPSCAATRRTRRCRKTNRLDCRSMAGRARDRLSLLGF